MNTAPLLAANRAAIGASQADLATMLGITKRGRINAWEKGRTAIPERVSHEVAELRRIYASIAATYTNAIREASRDQHTQDGWVIDCKAIADAATRITSRPTPQRVARHIATTIQTTLKNDGISVAITTGDNAS